jgi:TRAP-type mannitol/chloroaromatic compound transport system substrate-binding protein
MDRRAFLKNAGLAGAGAAAAPLAAPAIAQDRHEIRLVTSWPRNFPGLGTGVNEFAESVTRASGGRINLRVHGAGELVGPLAVHDAVQEGTAEMYHSADYYFVGKSRAYNFFTAVPLGFTSFEMDAWIMHGGGQEIWDEVGAQFNVKHLPGGNTGVQAGGWFRNEINTAEDLAGLRMRIPGLGAEIISALGGTPVAMAAGEILPALQSGTIDAAEFVGPVNDLALGFHQVLRNYYAHGIHEPGAMAGFGVNRRFWEGLSEDDQRLLETAAIAMNNRTTAYFNAHNADALEQIRAHGVNILVFNEEVFTALGEAGRDVIRSVAASEPLAQRAFDSFYEFRQKVIAWTDVADRAYMNNRALIEL